MDKKLPKGIVIRKQKSGNKSLYVTFPFRGIHCRECLKSLIVNEKNIKYAANLRTEILNRIATNRFEYSQYFPDSMTKTAKRFGTHNLPTTIAQLFDSIKWPDIAPKLTTAYIYQRDAKYAYAALGHLRVTDLTVKDIRDWIKTMPQLKRKTISNRLTPLRAVLAIAVDDGIIEYSAADKVNLGRQSKGLISREQRKSQEAIDVFSEAEIERILKAAETLSIQGRNYYQLAFYSGLRHSELAGLRWKDESGNQNIDFVNKTLNVNEALVSIGGKAYRQTPKTHSGRRIVNLVPMAADALQNQAKSCSDASGYVFSKLNSRSGPITHSSQYLNSWVQIMKLSGVRYRPPKQTRHTFASQLLSGGENIMYIAKQMGHVDATMILQRYGKWVSNSVSSTHKPVSSYGQNSIAREQHAENGGDDK